MSDLITMLRTEPLRRIAPSVWYPGFMPGLPDLLVMRMPPALRHRGLSGLNAEMRVLFVETNDDRKWVLRCLDRPVDFTGAAVDFLKGIDRLASRPSVLPRGDTGVLLYVPPEPGWPHFIVTMLGANAPGQELARQRYGWDAFPTEAAAQDHMAKMAAPIIQEGIMPEIRTPDPGEEN